MCAGSFDTYCQIVLHGSESIYTSASNKCEFLFRHTFAKSGELEFFIFANLITCYPYRISRNVIFPYLI